MMLAIIAALYAAVLIADFLPLSRYSAPGVRALYLVMAAASFALLALNALGVRVPSPAPPIEQVVRAIFPIQ